ncbi:MAG: hypothetical protein WKG07_06095 [Hymenobacter sp.]
MQEQGRAQWAQEENQALEAVRYGRDELRPHLRLAGKFRIAPQELPLFRELYALRDRLARQLDRPSPTWCSATTGWPKSRTSPLPRTARCAPPAACTPS